MERIMHQCLPGIDLNKYPPPSSPPSKVVFYKGISQIPNSTQIITAPVFFGPESSADEEDEDVYEDESNSETSEDDSLDHKINEGLQNMIVNSMEYGSSKIVDENLNDIIYKNKVDPIKSTMDRNNNRNVSNDNKLIEKVVTTQPKSSKEHNLFPEKNELGSGTARFNSIPKSSRKGNLPPPPPNGLYKRSDCCLADCCGVCFN